MSVVLRTRRVAIVPLAVLLALTLAVPLMGAKGGNTANAKACQKGGWEVLATAADPFGGFADESECVSAAAKGATLTGLLTTVVTVYRQWNGYTSLGRSLCSLRYSVANPNPAYTSYAVSVTLREGTTYVLSQGNTEPAVYGDSADYAIASASVAAQPGNVAVPVLIQDECVT